MVAAQVIGNDAAITIAGTGGLGGNFELNTMMPLIAYDLLQSIEILARVARLLDRRLRRRHRPPTERMRELVERSLAMVTALVPKIGYDAAAALAKEAMASGRTVREVALERKVLPREELDAILDPWRMTEGGIVGGARAARLPAAIATALLRNFSIARRSCLVGRPIPFSRFIGGPRIARSMASSFGRGPLRSS